MTKQESDRGRWDVLPVLVLAGLVALFVAGWFLYPTFQRFLSAQDCIATGRTNC
jgi:hypothetical protein